MTRKSWSRIIENCKRGFDFSIIVLSLCLFLCSCTINSYTVAFPPSNNYYTITALPTSSYTPQPASIITATITITATVTTTSTVTIPSTITPTENPLPPKIQVLNDLDSMDALDSYLKDTIHWIYSSKIESTAYGKNVEQTILETLNLNSGDCGEYSRLAYFVMRNHASNFKFVSMVGNSSTKLNIWHKILVYELPNGKYTYANSIQSVFLNQEPSYHQSFDSVDDVLRSIYYNEISRGVYISTFYINTTEELTGWSKQYPNDPSSNWITGLKPVDGFTFYGEIRTLQDLGVEPTTTADSSN